MIETCLWQNFCFIKISALKPRYIKPGFVTGRSLKTNHSRRRAPGVNHRALSLPFHGPNPAVCRQCVRLQVFMVLHCHIAPELSNNLCLVFLYRLGFFFFSSSLIYGHAYISISCLRHGWPAVLFGLCPILLVTPTCNWAENYMRGENYH